MDDSIYQVILCTGGVCHLLEFPPPNTYSRVFAHVQMTLQLLLPPVGHCLCLDRLLLAKAVGETLFRRAAWAGLKTVGRRTPPSANSPTLLASLQYGLGEAKASQKSGGARPSSP